MSAYSPSIRAFRFQAVGRSFALDIQNNGIAYPMGPAVHLFESTPQGWLLAYEAFGEEIYVTAATIAAAGGEAAMCRAIVARANLALAKLFGATLPPAETPDAAVMDRLRLGLSVQVIDGVPRLAFEG